MEPLLSNEAPKVGKWSAINVLGDCRLVLLALLKDPMTETFCPLPRQINCPRIEIYVITIRRRHWANSEQVGKLSEKMPSLRRCVRT